MIDNLFYATVISLILAMVLAVSREVPLLHLVLPPDTPGGDLASLIVGLPLLVCLALGFGLSNATAAHWLRMGAWLLALVLAWWIVGWHLWERR